MRDLQCKTGPDGYSDGYSQDRDFGTISSEIDYKKIIFLVNEKVELISLFKRYNIEFSLLPSKSGWTQRSICPFPNHKNGHERTGSFGFNPQKNAFNCFGCKKSGKAVEFLSEIESLSKLECAHKLLEEYNLLDVDFSTIDDCADGSKINDVLYNFSNYTRQLIQKHKNNKKIILNIDKIIYSLDSYLQYSISKGNLSSDNLLKRINKYKSYLGVYENL